MKAEKIVYFNPKIQKKIDDKSITNLNNISNNNIKTPVQNLTPKFLLNKKTNLFKVETFEEYYPNEDKSPKSGRWTLKEHIIFLQALEKFGTNWKKFKKMIKTRTANQIRSHCQKFLILLKKCKDDELGIDFTSDYIQNMNDVINHIKTVNKNFDVVNILLYISGKYFSNSDTKKSNIIKKAFDVNNIFDNEIKSNNNDEINNFNEAQDINEVNKLNEEVGNEKELINDNLYNINSFQQNMNFFNSNYNNIINNYINNVMIMNFVDNINNNISLANHFQNLNNLNIYNFNQNNSINNKNSEINPQIKNNNDIDCINIHNTEN